jgi:[acyl-carrier-protein] S-malonyltransferase
MGKDVWDSSPAGRAVLEEADRVLGYKLSTLCFEGPEEKLQDTAYSQPAIVAVSLACLAAALERGRVTSKPAFLAGHSLGEYAALVVAGALSLEDGLRLVQERGRLMAEASALNPGTLAAIVGLDEPTVERICAEADVDVCNRNLPNQTVIGGSHEGVAVAIEKAKAAGAQRAIELRVSGAFHSRLMAPANSRFAEVVAATAVDAAAIPVVANLTAAPLADAAAIREELVRQITRPVRWHESAMYIVAAGVRTFYEFGPGRVLTGFLRRLAPEASLVNVSGLGDPIPVDRGPVRA